MDPVVIQTALAEFNRAAMSRVILGSAMRDEVAQRLSDLGFGPIGMLRPQGGSFELAHFFHELQSGLEPLRGRHATERLGLLGMKPAFDKHGGSYPLFCRARVGS